MDQPQPSTPELLKTILEPLLVDFDYWFERSLSLLETEDITFLTTEEQSDLLKRVKQAQKEVNTAKMLFDATNGQVGVELSTMMPWHQLVRECWGVAIRLRSLASGASESAASGND
ncbi:MAG: DUF2605 domain-containing protein [Moorea sp. SIO1F2]|uniref:DUF2605 domain-containing protein n=1 Tax=Moorena sp. SIO1F2 TaxID=2607819 RepID=UPI0013BC9415|nr:DUF2605 domain-containing protein [Moorena sp. SIO1F2]NET84318.1 DUF2605 domain-containing protein [Moorena sp. SIO1F2]